MRNRQTGFTLIELLVVITIIVVLLALLIPAMDRAVYQAELATCGAQLKGVATGIQLYALDHRRSYPKRRVMTDSGLGGSGNGWFTRQDYLVDPMSGFDDRIPLGGHVDLDMLVCPMTGRIDLKAASTESHVFSTYGLWYGFAYMKGWVADAGKGMFRLGDRLEVGGRGYRVLASDWEIIATSDNFVVGTHPDREDVMHNVAVQDSGEGDFWAAPGGVGADAVRVTMSRWQTAPNTNWRRGLVDHAFAYDDGSVTFIRDLPATSDERVSRMPVSTTGEGWVTGDEAALWWSHLPRQ